MSFTAIVKSTLHSLGWHLCRYPTLSLAVCMRQRMFEHIGIDLVLDAGANVGQYGLEILSGGYRGAIESFEPVRRLYESLEQTSRSHRRWSCQALALGDRDGPATINVSGSMSSLLAKSPDASSAAPFDVEQKETIQMARLDSVFERVAAGHSRIWLKLDVQGFEPHVLDGATESLKTIAAVEVEMSLWPFYAGQRGYREMIDRMERLGFDLWSLYPGVRQPQSARLIEMDGIFVRKEIAGDGILRA